MRRFLAVASVVLFAAASANAATISVKLQDLTGGTAPGIHTIGIYLQSDQSTSADDLGISGAQIDVISQDLNSNYAGTISFTGGNVVVDGYSHINPAKVDGTTANSSPASLPGAETVLNNGNLDAMGLSFSTTPGNVDPTGQAGAGAIGQTSGYEFIAKEAWTFSATSVLKAFLVGPQYFDSADSGQATDTFHDYTAATQVGNAGGGGTGLQVPVTPEPTSFVLGGLGALGLAFVARRRKAA